MDHWTDKISTAAKGRRVAWDFQLPEGGYVRGHVLARWLRAWRRPERMALPCPIVLARADGDRLVIRAERAHLALRITHAPYVPPSRRKRRPVFVHWPDVPIVDPVLAALRDAPQDDEPVSEQEALGAAAAREEYARGEFIAGFEANRGR